MTNFTLICNNADRQVSSTQDQYLTNLLSQWVNKERWLESKDSNQEVASVEVSAETEVASEEEEASVIEEASEEEIVEVSEEEEASVIEAEAEEVFVEASEEDIEMFTFPYHLWKNTV